MERSHSRGISLSSGSGGPLSSQRGRWLLSSHAGAACELPVNGLVDGRLVHATIDRTFVCDGVRWVVDYKTGRPGRGESMTGFLAAEMDRYREQLRIYRHLMGRLYPEQVVKSALYLPQVDAWLECPVRGE